MSLLRLFLLQFDHCVACISSSANSSLKNWVRLCGRTADLEADVLAKA